MSGFDEYRNNANQQRRAAAAAQLPMVRTRLLQAAERWDQLADELERFQMPRGRVHRQEIFY